MRLASDRIDGPDRGPAERAAPSMNPPPAPPDDLLTVPGPRRRDGSE